MKTKTFAGTMVGLLILQFTLGILANLYSTIPSAKPEEVFSQFGFIMFHVLNGVLLLVLASVFLVRAIKRKSYVKEGIGGVATIVTSFAFGELFVFTQNDIFSFLMAVSFIGALINYAKVAYAKSEA